MVNEPEHQSYYDHSQLHVGWRDFQRQTHGMMDMDNVDSEG